MRHNLREDEADASPILSWIGDADRGAYLDLRRGWIAGYFWHDGEGTWEGWVCLPLWKAVVAAYGKAGVREWYRVDLLRCWVPLERTHTAWDAGAQIEGLCGSPMLSPDWSRGSEGVC